MFTLVNGKSRIRTDGGTLVPYFCPYELWGYSLKFRPKKSAKQKNGRYLSTSKFHRFLLHGHWPWVARPKNNPKGHPTRHDFGCTPRWPWPVAAGDPLTSRQNWRLSRDNWIFFSLIYYNWIITGLYWSIITGYWSIITDYQWLSMK